MVKTNGEPCSINSECETGFCLNGFCEQRPDGIITWIIFMITILFIFLIIAAIVHEWRKHSHCKC